MYQITVLVESFRFCTLSSKHHLMPTINDTLFQVDSRLCQQEEATCPDEYNSKASHSPLGMRARVIGEKAWEDLRAGI